MVVFLYIILCYEMCTQLMSKMWTEMSELKRTDMSLSSLHTIDFE